MINNQAIEEKTGSKRNAMYNLEEIKVRWKKAALENCIGVPCIITPPPPSFTCGTSTISDIDGNTYSTVSIGMQCWTVENLRVRKYNDGSAIPFDTSGSTLGNAPYQTWGSLTGAHTVNEHDSVATPSNLIKYGYLYNWYAATDGKKICPTGWHVPTDGDWTSLIQFIDPTLIASAIGTQSTMAGDMLKSTGTTLWKVASSGIDNYGFSALPGGYRDFDGSFGYISYIALFWSSSEDVSGFGFALYRSLHSNNSSVTRNGNDKSVGASVRCLRD